MESIEIRKETTPGGARYLIATYDGDRRTSEVLVGKQEMIAQIKVCKDAGMRVERTITQKRMYTVVVETWTK